jgi:hypothetical protein
MGAPMRNQMYQPSLNGSAHDIFVERRAFLQVLHVIEFRRSVWSSRLGKQQAYRQQTRQRQEESIPKLFHFFAQTPFASGDSAGIVPPTGRAGQADWLANKFVGAGDLSTSCYEPESSLSLGFLRYVRRISRLVRNNLKQQEGMRGVRSLSVGRLDSDFRALFRFCKAVFNLVA